MYVSKILFLTNSVSLFAVYQILSESASIWSEAVHISIWFRWHFPFGSWQHLIDWVDSLHRLSTPSGSELLQPPVSTLLCAMLTDPSTYLLECIKSFFDSMSIQLNQHDKTLSPVRPWQRWLVIVCPLWSFWYSLQRIFTLHWIWAPKIYSKC